MNGGDSFVMKNNEDYNEFLTLMNKFRALKMCFDAAYANDFNQPANVWVHLYHKHLSELYIDCSYIDENVIDVNTKRDGKFIKYMQEGPVANCINGVLLDVFKSLDITYKTSVIELDMKKFIGLINAKLANEILENPLFNSMKNEIVDELDVFFKQTDRNFNLNICNYNLNLLDCFVDNKNLFDILYMFLYNNYNIMFVDIEEALLKKKNVMSLVDV
jgi:hypothetical protein